MHTNLNHLQFIRYAELDLRNDRNTQANEMKFTDNFQHYIGGVVKSSYCIEEFMY